MVDSKARERRAHTRVAIVDDHRMVLDGVMAHVKSRRVDLDIVIHETTWLGLLSHPDFPVDVVVLDLNLRDGIPIGTKIRALAATGAHTVVISRHADAGSVGSALSAGALAFVPKTDSADELISAVRAVSAGRRYVSRLTSEALEGQHLSRDPGLGPQEQRALVLYAAGRSIKEVADRMGTTDETVKSYIKRARRKYLQVGVDVGTKILLRRRGIHEGWLTPE